MLGEHSDRVGALQQQGMRELLAIFRASQRLQYLLEPDSLAQQIIGVLEETLGYDYGAVLLIDHASGSLVPFALSDQGQGKEFITRDKSYVASRGVRLGTGITGWVAQNGESVMLGDIRKDARYHAIRDDIRSELCVPMRIGGKIVGVVNIETKTPNAYGEADRYVLESVASTMAIAIANAQLYEQTQRTQRMEMVGRLASGIIHDMNNILTVINGVCDLVLSNIAKDHPLYSDIELIGNSGIVGGTLTRQLLAFCREKPVVFETLNLNSIIENLESMLRRLVGNSIEMITAYGQKLGAIYSNSNHIEQIVLNLVLNAQQAMPEGGRIVIQTSTVTADEILLRNCSFSPIGSYVLLSIGDTGHGMSKETQMNIFKPFFTTKEHGTGLGLATVDRIVRESSGHICMQSEVGKGTTFDIYIPQCAEAEFATDYDV